MAYMDSDRGYRGGGGGRSRALEQLAARPGAQAPLDAIARMATGSREASSSAGMTSPGTPGILAEALGDIVSAAGAKVCTKHCVHLRACQQDHREVWSGSSYLLWACSQLATCD